MVLARMTTEDWGAVRRRVDIIEHEVDRLSRSMDGESEFAPGVIGILRRQTDRMETLDNRIVKIESTLDRVRWTVAGAAASGSLLGGGFVFLLTRWFESIG